MTNYSLERLHEAYEGVEDAATFPDDAAVESYRGAMLERSRAQADFLALRLPPTARAVEVGCGNGRLLIALATRKSLAAGLGLDVARSRVGFAQDWAHAKDLACLRFEAADALAYPLEPGGFSAALCITGALAYFEPIAEGSVVRLVGRLAAALGPGGLLCLELYPHPLLRRLCAVSGGVTRTWHELDPEDPWRFYLSRFELEGDIVTHEKTFIHRATGEVDTGRGERFQLYTAEAISEVLETAGFVDIELFEGWSDARYAGGDAMVITARR